MFKINSLLKGLPLTVEVCDQLLFVLLVSFEFQNRVVRGQVQSMQDVLMKLLSLLEAQTEIFLAHSPRGGSTVGQKVISGIRNHPLIEAALSAERHVVTGHLGQLDKGSKPRTTVGSQERVEVRRRLNICFTLFNLCDKRVDYSRPNIMLTGNLLEPLRSGVSDIHNILRGKTNGRLNSSAPQIKHGVPKPLRLFHRRFHQACAQIFVQEPHHMGSVLVTSDLRVREIGCGGITIEGRVKLLRTFCDR